MKRKAEKVKNIIRSIVVMFTTIFISHFFMITTSVAEQAKKSTAEQFGDAMKYANSLKKSIKSNGDKITAGNLEFDPKEVFKNQKGGYTENPPQIGYRNDVDVMEKSAVNELAKDVESKDLNDNPAAVSGKTVLRGFQTRPVYKVTKDDEYIAKSDFIKKNADDIVKGSSNDDIDCEMKEEDRSECRTKYIEKKCNEEVSPVRRVCEKNPHITIKEELYPGCQVRIHPTGKEECLIGTFGIGTHRKVVPRHLSSRVEVAGSRHGYFYVTVVNEITGKVLYNHAWMNNGVAFDLTFSDTQDQTFRLVADRSDGCSCRWSGHLTMYIDRKYKSANVDWKEENCRDI